MHTVFPFIFSIWQLLPHWATIFDLFRPIRSVRFSYPDRATFFKIFGPFWQPVLPPPYCGNARLAFSLQQRASSHGSACRTRPSPSASRCPAAVRSSGQRLARLQPVNKIRMEAEYNRLCCTVLKPLSKALVMIMLLFLCQSKWRASRGEGDVSKMRR